MYNFEITKNVRPTNALILALACMILLTPNSAFSLTLNGLSTFKEFNKDLYIGALYLDETTADESTVRQMNHGKMELRIKAEKVSHRKLSRLIVESLAINNTEEEFSSIIDDVVTLSQTLQDSLQFGDRITIESTPSLPVTIKLNDKKMITLKNPDIFSAILSIWIGEVPPSTEFKKNILSGGTNLPQALIQEFNALEPQASRQNIVAIWNRSKAKQTTTKKTAKAPTKERATPQKTTQTIAANLTKSTSPKEPLGTESTPLTYDSTPGAEGNDQALTLSNAPTGTNTPKPDQSVALNTLGATTLSSPNEQPAAPPSTENKLEVRREKNKRFLQSMRRR